MADTPYNPLAPNDLVYISYPRKRDDPSKASVLHDHDWVQAERDQVRVWKRNATAPQGHIDITQQVGRITKTGKRLDVEMVNGAQSVVDEEKRESAPGMLVGKVRGDDQD